MFPKVEWVKFLMKETLNNLFFCFSFLVLGYKDEVGPLFKNLRPKSVVLQYHSSNLGGGKILTLPSMAQERSLQINSLFSIYLCLIIHFVYFFFLVSNVSAIPENTPKNYKGVQENDFTIRLYLRHTNRISWFGFILCSFIIYYTSFALLACCRHTWSSILY